MLDTISPLDGIASLAIDVMIATNGASFVPETQAPPTQFVRRNFERPFERTKSQSISDFFESFSSTDTSSELIPTPKLLPVPRAELRLPVNKKLQPRIDQLKRLHAERQKEFPEEGYSNFSNSSEAYMLKFLRTVAGRIPPMLNVKDNGNIRALWEDEKGRQVGINFLTNGYLQFVLMLLRPGEDSLSVYYGTDTADGLITTLRNNKLIDLL